MVEVLLGHVSPQVVDEADDLAQPEDTKRLKIYFFYEIIRTNVQASPSAGNYKYTSLSNYFHNFA